MVVASKREKMAFVHIGLIINECVRVGKKKFMKEELFTAITLRKTQSCVLLAQVSNLEE